MALVAEAAEAILEELIPYLFGFSYWDCLITDESKLGDFEPEYPADVSAAKIEERFGIQIANLPDYRLVTICSAISVRRN